MRGKAKMKKKELFNNKGIICVVFIMAVLFVCAFSSNVFAESINKENSLQTEDKKSYLQTLKQIEEYQKQYWQIIKRNDMLIDLWFQVEGGKDYEKDKTDYDNLYQEVINKIDKNNQYYKKLESIGKNTDLECESQPCMNEYAQAILDETDTLLNEVYKDLKAKMPKSDFNKLKLSERKWLKDIEKYKHDVIDKQNQKTMGTMIGVLIPGAYEDMKKFRVLLLLLLED